MKPDQASQSRNALLIACTLGFICFFGSYMRIPIVPLFAASLGADSVQVGFVNGAFMLMAGALSIPAGLVSDRFGRRLPLLGALLLLAGSSLLLFWCQTPAQITAIYLFFGMGLAAFSPTLMSYVADVTPTHLLGQAYGWYSMAVYAGMTVGPAAGGFLGRALGLRQVFLVAGCLIFIAFLVALLLVRLPAKPSEPASHPSILPALASLMKNRRFVACLLATIGICFGFGSFVTFMPLYLGSLGMNTGHVGFVFAAQALANAFSRIPGGRLSDRTTHRSRLVIGGFAVFSLALAAFSLCRSLAPFMVTAALMGISMGIAFTAIGALIANLVPRQQRGLAMGCYNTCIYAGMMLSATAMGAAIKSSGFRSGFIMSGLFGAAVLVMFIVMFGRGNPEAAVELQ